MENDGKVNNAETDISQEQVAENAKKVVNTGGDLAVVREKSIVLQKYREAVKEQAVKFRALNNAIASYAKVIRNVSSQLHHMHEVMLTLYEESWPFYKELQICFEDEETVWKNYERDLQTAVSTMLGIYQPAFKVIEEQMHKHDKLQSYIDNLNPHIQEITLSDSPYKNTEIQKARRKLDVVVEQYDQKEMKLLEEFPKILASRVKYVSESFQAVLNAMSEFSTEMKQVHESASDIIQKLPLSNPKIEIGDGEKKIVLSVHSVAKRPNNMRKPPMNLGPSVLQKKK